MALDFLSADELQLMKDDFSDLINDGQVGVAITYKTYTGKSAFSKSTRVVTPTFTSSTVRAFRFPMDNMEIANSNGHYQSGDYKYMIKASDISNPKKDDRIVDNGVERYVHDSSEDSVGIFYSVVARSLNG